LDFVGSNPDRALNILQHLAQLDPDADLDPATPDTQETDPQVAIDNERARRSRDEGLQALENDDTETATELLNEALDLNPNIDLNPDTKEIEQDVDAVIDAMQEQRD
jgi:tetratricopeptide (TPR) repeat protein